MIGSIVRADPGKDATGTGPPFLVYDNFRTLMNWNRSVFFGVAAGTLADRIASR
jgi:membrane-bound lytic murein transglycosylase B